MPAMAVQRVDIGIAHSRLGHANYDMLIKTSQHAHGRQIVGNKPDIPCGSCEYGKGHRDSFPMSVNLKANQPFERIHFDLFGPVTPRAHLGGLHGDVFVDEYSGTIFCFILNDRKSINHCIGEITKTAHQFGKPVKLVESDGDPAFKRLMPIFEEESVMWNKSVPYTSQQNGREKRAIRTICEAAAAMLHGCTATQGILGTCSPSCRLAPKSKFPGPKGHHSLRTAHWSSA